MPRRKCHPTYPLALASAIYSAGSGSPVGAQLREHLVGAARSGMGQPSCQPSAGKPAAGHRGEIVETAQQALPRETFQDAKCEARAANPAAGQAER